MSERKKFTVDRATWRCGGDHEGDFKFAANVCGKGDTKLLNKEGYRCCLGFVASQLGVPDSGLKHGVPHDCAEQYFNQLCPVLVDDGSAYSTTLNSELADDAIYVNDDPELTREERERRLIEVFNTHGYDLEFSGEYAA